MASPFRIFRKYQKSLLVGAGVILMFVFVIGDALVGYLGGSRGGGGGEFRNARAVAVKWDGGSLTNSDVDSLVARRQITNAFLEQVEMLGARSAIVAGVEPRPLRVRPLRGPVTPQQGVERDVVQTKLFADAAREAGMSVSDEAVVQYLNELGRGKVTSDDMRELLRQMAAQGWGVTSDFVIEALRNEMLAKNYIASHLYAFQTVTPQERWTDWLRANDQVVVEAAAIPVDSFLIDVKDPTDAELKAFYDEWKNREASPDLVGDMELPSAAPGFRVPRKIDVQYVEANFDKFMTEIEGTITDEEIEKYYNENKDLFVKAADAGLMEEMEAVEETEESETPATDSESPEASPPANESEAAPPAEESGSETPPATESQPEEGAAPETGAAPEADAESEQPPVSEPSPTAAGETQPQSEEQRAPAEGDQSANGVGRKSVFRLAAFLQEGAAESAPEEPAGAAEEPAAGEPPASEPAAGAETAPAENAEAPATEAATEPAATPATESGESSAAQPPATDSAGAAETAEKPKEYQPLEEVKDIIRRRLAEDRVHEELTKRMDEIAGVLEAEFNKFLGQKLDAEAQKGDVPAPPAELRDLAALAEKQGFTVTKTGPMPWLEFRNTPVGKSGNSSYTLPLSSILFGTKELDLYEPIQTVDIDGNRYIAMKTSDVQGKVPELSEIRDEAALAYKKQKAAELALKDAEDQAKRAQESRSSLADFFADKQSIKVVQTDPFSQLTRGDAPDQFGRQPFQLSQPDGIVAPGLDFLRRIFDLKDGEVAAVLNNDHTLAYVIRIVEHVNSQDELRTAYLAEANTWDGLPTLMSEHFQMAQQMLFNDVVQKANLDWVRDPDPRPQDEVVD